MKHEEFCPSCEDYCEVETVERNETYTVRDREITVPVTGRICSRCGEFLGSDEEDQVVLDVVHSEYRRQLDLLSPERIKAIRKKYRLSQKSFARLLGMSEATMNRYEQGGLQDQSHDTAIRACECVEIFRGVFNRRGSLLTEWQRKRVEQVLTGDSESADTILDHLGEVDWICMPKEITERTGYRIFDYHRFAGVALWFCSQLKEVSRTTINKLMFYSDFLAYRHATVSLTGTAYRRAPFGPVPADFDGLLSRMESEKLLVREERSIPGGYVGYYYQPGGQADSLTFCFTDHEKQILAYVADSLGGMTAKAISEKSHTEPAWAETENGQLISYHLAERLSLTLSEE